MASGVPPSSIELIESPTDAEIYKKLHQASQITISLYLKWTEISVLPTVTKEGHCYFDCPVNSSFDHHLEECCAFNICRIPHRDLTSYISCCAYSIITCRSTRMPRMPLTRSTHSASCAPTFQPRTSARVIQTSHCNHVIWHFLADSLNRARLDSSCIALPV